MRRLIVLRPEPGASATLARARELGLDGLAVPLFTIQPNAWTPPDPIRFDGLLLTSSNAIRNGGDGLDRLRGLPAYAVGQATADTAREAGFAIAATGDGGVDRLLESIEPGLRLLHLCGSDRRMPQDPRQAIETLAVYRAEPVERPDLAGATDSVALVHSPRAGRRFAELVSDRRRIVVAAISREAADAMGEGWAAVEVAEKPSDDALLALAARLCNKPPAQ